MHAQNPPIAHRDIKPENVLCVAGTLLRLSVECTAMHQSKRQEEWVVVVCGGGVAGLTCLCDYCWQGWLHRNKHTMHQRGQVVDWRHAADTHLLLLTRTRVCAHDARRRHI